MNVTNITDSGMQSRLVLSVPLFKESPCIVLKVVCNVMLHYEMSRFLILYCCFLFFLDFM